MPNKNDSAESVKRAPSPALTYLFAAQEAMPRSIGDRVRISGMGESMMIALKCKFKFHKDDAEPLKQLQITTCVGVFRPIDPTYYSAACAYGSSFVRVWELATGVEPWIAHKVLAHVDHKHNVLHGSRVAVGLAVLVHKDHDAADNLAKIDSDEVWWCTSFDNEKIVLARYASLTRAGSPSKFMKMNRAQWAQLQANQASLETVAPLVIGKVAPVSGHV